MTPIIKINHLSCKMGHSYLLKDISWEVQAGENWVVYGLNGSGKTTLLSILAGYKSYSEGSLQIFGQTYTNENILSLRQKIGWVSGSFFDKHYTKESILDIILSGKFGTLSVDYQITLQDVQFAKKLAKELDILDKINYSFDMLSKGQRQNVMIARALMADPEILVLDEPCSGLDVYHRAHLFSSIRQLSKMKNLTIIYVTHYTEEIIELFDHTLLLSKGHVFAQGLTKSLINTAYLTAFLGYPVQIVKEPDNTQKAIVKVDSHLADLFKEMTLC